LTPPRTGNENLGVAETDDTLSRRMLTQQKKRLRMYFEEAIRTRNEKMFRALLRDYGINEADPIWTTAWDWWRGELSDERDRVEALRRLRRPRPSSSPGRGV